jgi:CubicO group peptidase (beta-lactamase class C family)
MTNSYTPVYPALLLTAVLGLPGCAGQPQPIARTQAVTLDAQEQRFASDLDAFMGESLRRVASIPAVSVAISRSDGPIYVRAFGKADIERNIQATPHTRFYIASSTKSYVGLAFALLDRRHLIDLDWTLAELAPDVQFTPELRASEVTLRHLLSHTHGLIAPELEFRLAYTGEHSPDTLRRLLRSVRPNPGAPLGRFAYSNAGYNIAALLIERRLGRPWQQIVEQEVLAPLRARETHARGMDPLRRANLVAAPYLGEGPEGPERLTLIKSDSNMQSAGGLFASGSDLAVWLQLQLAAHNRGVIPALPREAVVATHASIGTMDEGYGPFRRTAYGLGWFSGPFQGESLYHAFGGFSGARAHVSFMPARDLGVAVVANDEGAATVFVDMVAIYTYTWFGAGPEAARQQGEQLLELLIQQAASRTRSIAEDRARRASRTWQLSLPRAAYAGRYCNEEWGTIIVAADDRKFHVSMGMLNADATPFTERDAVRVEFIPYQGTAVPFTIKDGRVTALRAFDSQFARCG